MGLTSMWCAERLTSTPRHLRLRRCRRKAFRRGQGTAPPVLDIRGPAFYSEDVGLMKRFTAGGDRSFEFRVDLVNALNRSGVGNLDTNLSSTTFGRLTGIGIGARRLQLSLRATF